MDSKTAINKRIEELKEELKDKLLRTGGSEKVTIDQSVKFTRRAIDISVDATKRAVKWKLQKSMEQKAEKDLAFLIEMREHLNNDRSEMVGQMLGDWIDELESTDLKELSTEEMMDIRGGVEVDQEHEGFTNWPKFRAAVNEITGKD